MKIILEVRNAAEYDAFEPSRAEGEAVRNAWTAVLDWSDKQQLTHEPVFPDTVSRRQVRA